MAGMFELFIAPDSSFRFRLTAPDGTVMAVSKAFGSKAAAVEGIAAVREYAGMGLIKDIAPASSEVSTPQARDAVAGQVRGIRRISVEEIHARPAAVSWGANARSGRGSLKHA
jgi:uncharacterized protein YegP (UPF0339 family)